jgi:predicted nucleic acid-binding protein
MLLPDVNVLIYAHREDSTPDHSSYARWVMDLATSPSPFALSVLAIAIEHGCTLITTDADFARFPGVRWQHPLRAED